MKVERIVGGRSAAKGGMTAEREDFGARLRRAREERGITLTQIAAITKIGVIALEALERNDVSRLPGGLFSRAFVRAYAREVGLDPERTVQEFAARFGDDSEAADAGGRPARNYATTGGSAVRWLGLLVTVVLVGIFFGVSRYIGSSGTAQGPVGSSPVAGSTSTVEAQPVADLPAAGMPPAGVATDGQGVPGPPAATSLQQPAPVSAAPAAAVPATDGGAGTIVDTTPSSASSSNAVAPLRVVLTSQAPCWIAASVDGKRIAGRMLQAGERLTLTATDVIELRAGNAGALSVTINDAPGRALGTSGEVVTVSITAANYHGFLAR